MSCVTRMALLLCSNKELSLLSMVSIGGWAASQWTRLAISQSVTVLRAAAYCLQFVTRDECRLTHSGRCKRKTLFRTAAGRKQGGLTDGGITAASALTPSMIAPTGTRPKT